MFRALLIGLFLIFLMPRAAAAPSGDTLQVVNWNLEWFADGHTHNAKTQVSGVRTLMNTIDADVYALCEIVNPDSLRSLVASLPGYGYVLSNFGSFAGDTLSGNWPGAQKLALVYRKSILRNVSGRPMMASSAVAYNSFASGRFPYEVAAEVKGRDGLWRSVKFIVIHAKAMADAQSCSRRIEGCRELKDTLDRYRSSDPFLILGDFNDDLDVSNCSSFAESNYWYMVRDSLHYVPLTLSISRAGAFSSDGYSSLIDHVVASDEMARYYVPGSAEVLRSFVKSIFPNYDNDISDHFPVRTRYVIDAAATTAVSNTQAATVRLSPNPSSGMLHVNGGQWSTYTVYDMQGRMWQHGAFPVSSTLQLNGLANGPYLLHLEGQDGNVSSLFRLAQ